jgi:methyl-accepting chemotaxis protein
MDMTALPRMDDMRTDDVPEPADPLTIGQITIRAVDQIGAHAATEIEDAAAQIREGAEEVASRLEQLAEAIRSHSKIASEHTAAFVNRTTQVLETVRALGAKLESPANGATREGEESHANEGKAG